MTEPPLRWQSPLIPIADSAAPQMFDGPPPGLHAEPVNADRYARAMSLRPLGDDATARQREKDRADNQARAEAIHAEREAQLAEAEADWTALRDQLAANLPALAALELHQPYTYHWICCATCNDNDEPADWPCDTYKAIKAATL